MEHFYYIFLGWGETESTWYVGHYLASDDDDDVDDECGVVGGMRIGMEDRSTRTNQPQYNLIHHKSHIN
jgi:hypothetical protein